MAATADEDHFDASVRPGDAVDTYRLLRFGILAAVVMLFCSVGYERFQVDCWQTSISAYYYTPVRSILVGALIAIGLCLIVIRGRGDFEDIMLNLAGMFAPVVALVPTSDAGRCYSIRQSPDPTTPGGALADWVVANIKNNIFALLVTGALALIAAFVFAIVTGRRSQALKPTNPLGRVNMSLLVSLLVLLVGSVLFFNWEGFKTHAHFVAAVLMFVFFAIVVAQNALRYRGQPYGMIYGVTLLLMVLASALALLPTHPVLWLEVAEIVLFAFFWLVQTVQLWSPEQAAESAPSKADPGPPGHSESR